jgi:acyl-coenzyme A synthetase/AMP-(fatty) acid ligase
MDDIIVTMAFNVNAVHVEEAIINHPDIAEVAVARGPHLISVEVPYGFIVLKKDVKRVDKEIEDECVQKVISTVGPWLYFSTCIIVEELPRNRAGKVLRRLLTNILYDQEIKATGMMINPHVLDDIKHKVKERGLGPIIDISISDP